MHGFFEEEARLYNDITFLKYYRNKFIYALIYSLCHLITTCSETATQRLRLYNKNTHTIYGGVDLSLFNPSLNDSFKKPDGTKEVIIGYAGNGRRWQGLEFLLESFSVLVERDPSFSLRLLLSEPVRVPDIKNMTVYGALPHAEVARFNAECDILVIPRLDNVVNKISFPSKLMEYLAMGKVVVGSKTSDIHRIITNMETGMLYDPGDTEAFISCLVTLKDPLLRERLGNQGYKLAKDHYSWEMQGQLFARLLKNVDGK
jgi:glycosyltransferase involved in cell wall biosynthesis